MPAAARLMLGIISAGLILVGLAQVMLTDSDVFGGVLVRSGLLLGAAWLVAPLIRRPTVGAVAFAGAAVLVVLRPRLIVVVAVAAVLWWLARRGR